MVEVFAVTENNPKGIQGFINVVASGPDRGTLEQKVRKCLEAFTWSVTAFESVDTVDAHKTYESEVDGLIADVLQNPEHVRLATLHTYWVN